MSKTPSTEENSCLESICLPFLLQAQNPDGSWGFHPGGGGSVEATAWSLLALAGAPPGPAGEKAMARGLGRLCEFQLGDGSWPAFGGQLQGCWVTTVACLALHVLRGPGDSLQRGLEWVGRSWPGEGGFWWRWRNRLAQQSLVVGQDVSLRGWSWTPGTSSWVEPTALALILLSAVPESLHPKEAARRRQLGEGMLYDRMCPGGGWNCGNPMVYGIAGEPAVGPTAWALLALQSHAQREENQQALAWLSRAYPDIQGPGSLALAHLCLRAYRLSPPPLEPVLHRLHQSNRFLHNVEVAAWVTLALSPIASWPGWVSPEGRASE